LPVFRKRVSQNIRDIEGRTLGGSMGGAANTVKSVIKNPLKATPIGMGYKLATQGGPVGRGFAGLMSGGLSEAVQKNPYDLPINSPFGPKTNGSQPISGPFELDQAQFGADRSAIQELGNKQYTDTLAGIDKNASEQQKYAGEMLKRMTPDIEEGLNAQHLLNSSALPQEIAKQASNLSQDVASQRANAIQAALTGRQGFETGALQRGLSLEDFVNQANVAKSIGAQFAPQVGNGKGTAVSGLGAGAAAGAPFGPWGAAIGGGAGALLGSNKAGK
jgi:hypothetical protein